MKSNHIKLSDDVKIRKEHFGGILFDTKTGDIVDVDREAFTVISIIKEIEVVDMKALLSKPIMCKGKRIRSGEIKGVISRLIAMGIIHVMPEGILSDKYRNILEEKNFTKLKWPAYSCLSAPETIHWAVTFKCDKSCPDCYIQRHKRLFTNELDTEDSYKLINKIANMGVFQLAIGGGEPLLRNDLEDIVRRAWEKGLVVHITTGKYEIEQKRLDILAKYIKVLQIGIKTDELISGDIDAVAKLKTLVKQLTQCNITTGANIIMTKSTIRDFDKIIDILLQCGFERYTLLRYKPPINIKRWLQEKPDRNDLYFFEGKLKSMQEMHPDISFRIDCALSFLQRGLSQQTALYSGIRGCVAGERIISVTPDGSVYPCSQLVGDIFKAGNLLNDDFESMWYKSKVLKKYRGFRRTKSFKSGDCGKCRVKEFCGGCRVFADDAIGSDAGCPEPLYESKYEGCEYDVIADIQDMIGYADAGFPYATREEIEKWLEEDSNKDYPSWIKNIK